MKKTIIALVAIFTLAGLTSTAQKGSKYLIGSVSYEKSTGSDAVYSLSPKVGYYLTNKSSLGVFGTIGESADGSTTSVGVFGRNDFMKVGKNCIVFAEAALASNSTKTAGVKASSFEANVGLGANYILNSKWGLTMNLANVINYVSADGNSTTTIGFGGVNNPFATANFGLFYQF